jgi:diacylglycerol kinase
VHAGLLNSFFMNSVTAFSWRARLKSFQYAGAGIRHFFQTEHNARLHAFFTLLMIAASCLLHPSKMELLVLAMVTIVVWIAEMLNTCIEKTLDLISAEKHPQIKIIKDMAAASVLLASMLALFAGAYIFIPKILNHAPPGI